MVRNAVLTIVFLSLVVTACGDESGIEVSDETETPEVFIALTKDFADFQTWPFVELSAGTHASADVTGPKKLYVNSTLYKASSRFPVGSIIVKTTDIGTTGVQVIHAMAKRGGDFNETGAKNWEWFELQIRDDQELIIWRGEAPPAGTSYGIDDETEEQNCNNCHTGSSDSTIVKSSAAIPRGTP